MLLIAGKAIKQTVSDFTVDQPYSWSTVTYIDVLNYIAKEIKIV